MSNKIDCQNQQPAYSGITINITNPAINPPAQNKYYCSCQAENNPPATTQNVIYAEQYPQLQQEQAETMHQAYINKGEYLEPVNNRSENANEINQNVYDNSKTINQYITQPSNAEDENKRADISGYPAEYYTKNYGIIPEEQTSGSAKQEYGATEENVGKEIIKELDEKAEKEKELEANGKKTKVVALTNEYIMSLENYLNNPNKDIRLMASKEIINRFNEDSSRYNDAALNALINKMLQDPEKLIRVAAFSALSSELASGNDYTVTLLTKVQQDPEADPNDVLEASEILLKRASMTEVRYVKSNGQEQRNVTKAGKETKEVENE